MVAGITPFNFPVMVPLWMMANAVACGNCFVLKPSEKDPSASLLLADMVQRGGLPRRCVQRRAGRPARRSTRCWPTPTSRPSPSSAARRWRATSTRRGRATASGSRRSVGRRTTWSSCPTPTSTPRPTPRCPPATARPASAAWRSRWSSPSGRWPTTLVDAIAARIPDVVVGAGDDPASMMGPLITAEHRDRVRSYVERAPGRGRQGRRRRFERRRAATASSSAAPCSTT